MTDETKTGTRSSALLRAYRLIEQLEARLASTEAGWREPIAVIGMGCRFPGGASDPESFWELLAQGRDGIREVPPDRWDQGAWFDPDPDAPGKSYMVRGGFLDEVYGFDAALFEISPREASRLDPQQRLLLEVAWEALENAAIAPDSLTGSATGIFIGLMYAEYGQLAMHTSPPSIDAYMGTGGGLSFPAGRLAYFLGTQGPSLVVSSECSSSLVSAHLACQALRARECDLALAGGVSLMLFPHMAVLLSKMRALSPRGRSRAFDAGADGYGRGEGCGVVVLKRLTDAVAAGDRVLAVIRGSAVNHDGRSGGLTVPNGVAQEKLLRTALAASGVEPSAVSFVEAHGTGTPLGDPIEVRALHEVYGRMRAGREPLLVGGLKPNIGHLEAAAGVAGICKVVLALEKRAVPPNLCFDRPNPKIPWEEIPIEVPTRLTEWRAEAPRIAGVSSFGLSGINAHMLLAEAPAAVPDAGEGERGPDRPAHLLCLAARSAAALDAQVRRWGDFLERRGGALDLGDVCFSAGVGRAHLEHRVAVVAGSVAEARGKLARAARRGVVRSRPPKAAFLFTGQGSQYVQMGRGLFATEPAFRAALERCDALLAGSMERPLLEILYPDGEPGSGIERTAFTQPALFALEYCLAQLLLDWGLQPVALLGHSVGEYVAACVAGVFSLEDGLRLVATRGRLMQELPEAGAMLAVSADESSVAALVEPYGRELSIAAVNGPRSVVVSGCAAAVAEVGRRLSEAGVRVKSLDVSHAFHSALMAPAVERFRPAAEAVRYAPPAVSIASNLTGGIASAELASPDYWCRHITAPVRFAAGLQSLAERGVEVFVEVGPQPVLAGMGRQCLPDERYLWLPTLRAAGADWPDLLGSLGRYYEAGGALDFAALDRGRRRRRLALPTYPFERQIFRDDRAALAARSHASGLYELVWRLRARTGSSGEASSGAGTWLVLADRGGVGAALAGRLEALGRRCLLVPAGQEPDLPGDAQAPLAGVVHLGSLDAPPTAALTAADLERTVRRTGAELLGLVRLLGRRASRPPLRLWLVSRGAVPAGGAAVQIAQAPLWGFGKVVPLEHPDIATALVDLPAEGDPETLADALAAELTAGEGEDQVALRAEGRYVPRLVRSDRALGAATIDAGACYLVTGGTGALGTRVAAWLVARGAGRVFVLGRRGETEAVREARARLGPAGERIEALRADVTDERAMREAFAAIAASGLELRGVIHAAGGLARSAIADLSTDAWAATLGPKVAGTWLLHELTLMRPLDFFICFSSIASLWSARGQADYAGANSFLDLFACHRRGLGLPALAVNWGPWTGGGLAGDAELQEELRRMGIFALQPEAALDTLGRLLAAPGPQIAVVDVDWPLFKGLLDTAGRGRLLAELAGAPEEHGADVASGRTTELTACLRQDSPGERRRRLTAHVRGVVARVLGMAEPDLIDPTSGFFDLGVDSFMAVEIRNALERDLGKALPATVTFDYPSADDLVRHLLADVLDFGEAVPVSTTPAVGTDDVAPSLRSEPIAIVGMACRFPGGAADPEAFWRLLRDGVDAVTEIPRERWDVDAFYDPDPEAAGKIYVRHGAFLEWIDEFDAGFFGISPREACSVDPQQRLLLEVSWEALESAGEVPGDRSAPGDRRTGVFVGISSSDYGVRILRGGRPADIDVYFNAGNALNAAAGRLSYALGLRGPSLAVDTACSSSLVALHLACASLRNGECDRALAGGVNALLAPESMVGLCRARMVSPYGRCRTFDARADGYVRGEGCGVVVLKRLSAALREGDEILAVIRGSAVNQDGASGGLTVPNGLAQQQLLWQALAVAGLAPGEVSLVETHGTGTSLGDPIEVSALGAVFGKDRDHGSPLVLGAVKTNIGHLESAAGIAGVLKVVLALRHQEIPPNLHFESPNPHIPWSELPVVVPTRPTPWPANGRPRVAGVSSFGFTGTNAHVLLAEAPRSPVEMPEPAPRSVHLLALSAKTPRALEELAGRYRDHLSLHPDAPLADLCFSANTGRSHFEHRLALAARSADELREQLQAGREGRTASGVTSGSVPRGAEPAVAFLFTGQGSQSPGMGRRLYETQPVFRRTLDRCDEVLRECRLSEVIGSAEALAHSPYAQPALFAVEVALAEMWRSWGVEPAVVLGHSLGEYGAACVAGVLSLEDGLRLVAERGRLMAALPETGKMIAVFAAEERVAPLLRMHAESVGLAAVNGPDNVVLSGRGAAVDAIAAALRETGIETRPLHVAHAFHSPLVEPMLAGFAEIASRIEHRPPRLPIFSNVTGRLHPRDAAPDAAYWTRQSRETVRFSEALASLLDSGQELFLEIGPRPVLSALGKAMGARPDARWLASLAAGRDDWDVALESLSALYVRGVNVKWAGVDAGHLRRRVPLPTYPFQRKSYWLEGEDMNGDGQPATPTEVRDSGRRQEELVSSLRALVAGIMRAAPEDVDIQAPFVEMGADSLILVEAVRLIEDRYGVKMTIRQLFEEAATVEKLAGYLGDRLPPPASAPPLPPLSPPSSGEGGAQGSSPSGADDAVPDVPPAGLAGLFALQLQTVSQVIARQLEVLQRGSPAAAAAVTEIPQPQPTAMPATPVHEKPAGVPARGLTPQQERHLQELVERYTRRTRRSKELTQAWRGALADSRATVGFRFSTKEMLYPVVGQRAAGSRIWDVDGNEYVDVSMGFGVHLFGNRPSFLREAIAEELANGVDLGPRSPAVGEVAALIAELTGHERVAFCNSGTEAVMTAIRLARARTGRSRIAIFAGSYHGHSDGTLAERTRDGQASSPVAPGIPQKVADDVVVLDYGSAAALEYVAKQGCDLAAVLVEPVQSRRPSLQPVEFLRQLRGLTRDAGCALLFDEMILGFRVHPGGAQGLFGVQADLATYGKIVGGGMPIGVVAGSAAYLNGIDGGPWEYGDGSYPREEMTFFGGTFCQHPLAMAAARAVLRHLKAAGPGLQADLSRTTAEFAADANALFARHAAPMRLDHFGSLFRLNTSANTDLFFYHLLERGVYVWEWRSCFLSTAHTRADLDFVLAAVDGALSDLRDGGFLNKAKQGDGEDRAARDSPLQGRTSPGALRAVSAPAPAEAAEAPRRKEVPQFLARRRGSETAPVIPAGDAGVQVGARDFEVSLSFFGKYDAEFRDDKYDLLFESCRWADERGFAAVWVPERHFHSFGGLSPNPSVLAAALARTTRKLGIRAGSCVLPLHNPIRVAEEWALVDNLSHGRVGVAFASGWHPDDFVLAPEIYGNQRELTFRHAEIVQRLWRGETVSVPGGTGANVDVRLHPLPMQPELPVWLTIVNNPETYVRAGELGAGVLTNLMGQTLDDLAGNIARYRQALRESGWPAERGRVTLLLHTFVADDLDRARETARKPFVQYLQTSMSLFRNLIRSEGLEIDLDRLTAEDREQLCLQAYERYVRSSALIGTPESCHEVVARLRSFGVDEIAAFVDFGVDGEAVLSHLPWLDRLRQLCTARPEPQARHEVIDWHPGEPRRLPLSLGQQQLWILSQISPEGLTAYTDVVTLDLRGPLRLAALRQAFARLVSRHEALRASIGDEGGEQVVAAAVAAEVPVVEIAEDELDEWLQRESRAAIDLHQAPTLLARLLRLAEERHVLVLRAHHILVDGWSIANIIRELSELYCAECEEGEERKVELAPVRQLSDLVAWQESQRDAAVWQQNGAWWLALFADPAPALDLPCDRPRPAVKTYRGRRETLRLDPALCRRLREAGRAHGCTLFMTLLAGFALLLRRVCQQDDLTLGIGVSGRLMEGGDGLLGSASQLLPLRLREPEDVAVRDFLKTVRSVVLDAFEHQNFSYALFVQKLGRTAGGAPLVSAVFNLDRPMQAPRLTGLAASLLLPDIGHARFDLNFNVLDLEDELLVEGHYDADLFEAATVRRLLACYELLLQQMCDRPEARLSVLSLVGGEDRRRLLVGWNATQVERKEEPLVHRLIAEQARRTPRSIAIRVATEGDEGGSDVTFAELEERTRRMARHLRSLGVGPETVVGVYLRRSTELVVSLLAVLEAGGAYLPLDPAHPRERLEFMLRDGEARLVLTVHAAADELAACGVPCVLVDEIAPEADGEEDPAPSVGSAHLAYVMYTSGSTGRPKGVMVTHGGLASYVLWCLETYPLSEGWGVPLHSSIGFDATLTSIFPVLCCGRTVVVVPEEDEIAGLAGLLQRAEGLALVKLTPSHLDILGELLPGPELRGRTRALVLGGEALAARGLAAWTVHAPETRIFNEYGPTETVVGCSCHEGSAAAPVSGTVPVGRPVANAQLYVLDRSLQLMPPGVRGELYVGGAGVARGYFAAPALTAERFLPHPFAGITPGVEPGARLYRTGDRARHLEDGNLELLGRTDDQIKIRGCRVEPGEIVAALRRHPAVQNACVVLRGDRLVAYVAAVAEPPGGAAGLRGELQLALKESLPAYMLPGEIAVLAALPLTANGKVDVRRLPEVASGSSDVAGLREDPRNALEERIAAVWRDVLGLERVGVHQNFFDLGGHSHLVISVHRQIRDFVPRKISLLDLFRHPTIASLAELLAEGPNGQGASGPAPAPTPAPAVDRAEAKRRAIELQGELRRGRSQHGR